jgi:hypothetical protein
MNPPKKQTSTLKSEKESESDRLAREAQEMAMQLAALREAMAKQRENRPSAATERGTIWRAGASTKPHTQNKAIRQPPPQPSQSQQQHPQQSVESSQSSHSKENTHPDRQYEPLDDGYGYPAPEEGDHAGGALWGDYREDESAASFQEALKRWRTGSSAPPTHRSHSHAAELPSHTPVSTESMEIQTSSSATSADLGRFAAAHVKSGLGEGEHKPCFFESIRAAVRLQRTLALHY